MWARSPRARQSCSRDLRGLPASAPLEGEAIYIIREVAAELGPGVLLFSGGKDSAVLLQLARKAFWPARVAFPVMHVDTGHNFPEVIEYRDATINELDGDLIVASRSRSRSIAAGSSRRPVRAPRAAGFSR